MHGGAKADRAASVGELLLGEHRFEWGGAEAAEFERHSQAEIA
jgi:hypothetical protein